MKNSNDFNMLDQIILVITFVVGVTVCFLLADTVQASEKPALPEILEGYDVEEGFEWFPSMPHVLFFVGGIHDGQNEVLDRMLRDHPEIDTIALHSGGGLVSEAAEMSKVIFEREMTSYVPRGGKCASACGYMWLAGKVRVLDGELGAHQISVGHEIGTQTITINESYKDMQKLASHLMIWMYEYEVPVLYYAWMFYTPSDDMYFFTPEEEEELVRGEDTAVYNPIDNLVSLKYMYLTALREWRDANVPEYTTH